MKLTNDGYRIAFLEEYKDVCKIGKSVLVKLISLDRKNDSVNKRDLYEILNEFNIIFLKKDGNYIAKNGKILPKSFVDKALNEIEKSVVGYNKICNKLVRKIK